MSNARLYLRAVTGATSFNDTCACCEAATRLDVGIVSEILGKDRYFSPGMNPHDIYDFNNNLIGEEKLRDRQSKG
jgi:hypothetical protein